MFTGEQIELLQKGYGTVGQTYFKLMSKSMSVKCSNAKSHEYVLHGFLRRLGTLQRCIENVYSIYPPNRGDIPSRHECVDLAINLQSFVFNVFGCLDNLAWVWAIEKQVRTGAGKPLRPNDISFQKKLLRETLPADFRDYLTSMEKWFEYIEDYRHALAHRIPLYVVPYTVTPVNEKIYSDLNKKQSAALKRGDYAEYDLLEAEQLKLGKFRPMMAHSHDESPGVVYFHGQMLADWNTVAEISEKFFEAMGPVFAGVER
jgi:hypothetical protein